MTTDDERLAPNSMKRVDPLQLEQGRLPVFETKTEEHIHQLQLENEALRMDLANAAQQRQLKDDKITALEQELRQAGARIEDLEETVRAREAEIDHLTGVQPASAFTTKITPADLGTLAWIRVNGKVLEQMVRWWRETVSVGEALDRSSASNVGAEAVPLSYEERRDQAMEKLEGSPLAARSGVGQADNAEPPDETCGL